MNVHFSFYIYHHMQEIMLSIQMAKTFNRLLMK